MTANGRHIAPQRYLDLISFDTFSVSWVGPLGEFVCYGSDDSRLKFVHPNGGEIDTDPITESGEAINGLAAIDFCQVVTTRSDIVFMWNQFIPGANKKSAHIQCGAHGVVATLGGCFVAPMGERGLMFVNPAADDVFVSNDPDNPHYFYQSIALPGCDNGDVIVSAIRKKGVAVGILPPDLNSHRVNTITPQDIDVIDVCGLGNSLAAAALGKNRTLILFRDILDDKDPVNLKFKSVEGVAYRVLCSRGHVFILTNKGFYVLANLAADFLAGRIGHGENTRILTLTVTAVDANLLYDRFVHIVNDEGDVFRLDIEKVERDVPPKVQSQVRADSSSVAMAIDWNDSSFETHKGVLQFV